MGQVNQLVEQQVRAFEFHQRHVDEMTQRALLESGRWPSARTSLAPASLPHAKGWTGVLEVVGLQFEKALTAVLDSAYHS